MTRRFLALALALLLGLAQHAALAHAIAHHAPLSHGDEHDRRLGGSAHDHAHAYAHGESCAQTEHHHQAPEGAHANCALDALYVQVLGGTVAVAVSGGPFGAPREALVSDDFLSALPAAVLAAAPRGPPAATPPL